MYCKYFFFSFFFIYSLWSNTEENSLFNGVNLSGWSLDVPSHDKNSNLPEPFIVRDGMIVSLGKPFGHLITEKEFKNYYLNVEYRFVNEPGNCGILVHASIPRNLYKLYPQSIEIQMNHKHAGDFWCIVENIEVDNMVKRRGPKEKWGITEGKARRILNLTDDSENFPGEWNRMKVMCFEDEVKVWVNDELVNHGFACTAKSGKIAIQSEGSEVEFRKLDIKLIR